MRRDRRRAVDERLLGPASARSPRSRRSAPRDGGPWRGPRTAAGRPRIGVPSASATQSAGMLTPLATVSGIVPGKRGLTSSSAGTPWTSPLTWTFATDVSPMRSATCRAIASRRSSCTVRPVTAMPESTFSRARGTTATTLPVGPREDVERVLGPRQVLLDEQRAVALDALEVRDALDQPDAARAAAHAGLDDHRAARGGGVERPVRDHATRAPGPSRRNAGAAPTCPGTSAASPPRPGRDGCRPRRAPPARSRAAAARCRPSGSGRRCPGSLAVRRGRTVRSGRCRRAGSARGDPRRRGRGPRRGDPCRSRAGRPPRPRARAGRRPPTDLRCR